jgi:hypothetical protein
MGPNGRRSLTVWGHGSAHEALETADGLRRLPSAKGELSPAAVAIAATCTRSTSTLDSGSGHAAAPRGGAAATSPRPDSSRRRTSDRTAPHRRPARRALRRQAGTILDWYEAGKIPPEAVVRLGGTPRGRLRFKLDVIEETWSTSCKPRKCSPNKLPQRLLTRRDGDTPVYTHMRVASRQWPSWRTERAERRRRSC